jgi:hypothetical protein
MDRETPSTTSALVERIRGYTESAGAQIALNWQTDLPFSGRNRVLSYKSKETALVHHRNAEDTEDCFESIHTTTTIKHGLHFHKDHSGGNPL